jgi:ribosomal protein S18 acetylase RimI-like enzyme
MAASSRLDLDLERARWPVRGERHVIEIRRVSSAGDVAAARSLFRQYAASLDVDLGFQGFAAELAGLPGDYAPPRGALLLAWAGPSAVGCVALRPLEWPDVAELKRLYVLAQGRGHGLGARLSIEAMTLAGRAGYRRLRLDTLPTMRHAQRLYEGLGFREIEPYRFNPVPGTRYMECTLERAR